MQSSLELLEPLQLVIGTFQAALLPRRKRMTKSKFTFFCLTRRNSSNLRLRLLHFGTGQRYIMCIFVWYVLLEFIGEGLRTCGSLKTVSCMTLVYGI